MEEMLQLSAGLSGPAQYEFFDSVTKLAEELREALEAHDLIVHVPKDHKSAWAAVRNKLIAHVDGGVANIPALGAAPVAIRVGTYMVRPGHEDNDRERFSIKPQLVDELFASAGSGIFNSLYPDMGAVRDAARMATEAAGAVAVAAEYPDLDYLLLHGALVNPVSRYSDTPSRTLMAHIGKDTYSHIHYDSSQARVISVREAARLQSFPDGFVFAGTMNPAFRQIGNAVPPLMAKALASEILRSIAVATDRGRRVPTKTAA